MLGGEELVAGAIDDLVKGHGVPVNVVGLLGRRTLLTHKLVRIKTQKSVGLVRMHFAKLI